MFSQGSNTIPFVGTKSELPKEENKKREIHVLFPNRVDLRQCIVNGSKMWENLQRFLWFTIKTGEKTQDELVEELKVY